MNNNISINKNTQIILQGKSNKKILNNNKQDNQIHKINNYIENKYKLILKKENEDIQQLL